MFNFEFLSKRSLFWTGICVLFLSIGFLKYTTASSAGLVNSAYVFPNPVVKTGLSKMHIEGSEASSVVVSIFDLDGEKVLELSRTKDQHSFDIPLDVDQFQSGVYTAIVKFYGMDNSVTQKEVQFTVVK